MIKKNLVNNNSIEILKLKKDIREIKNDLTNLKNEISIEKQKFVIFKGKEGFADRLQCLLQIIKYSISTKRTLVIDWRDEDWSHEAKEPINTYFELKGINNISILEFLRIWKKNKQYLSVFPLEWKNTLEENNYSQYLSNPIYQLPNESKCIEQICNKEILDFRENIIIYPGILHRTFDTSFMKYIYLSNPLRTKILDFSEEFSLKYLKYDVIHLRGASKTWMGGELPENSPVKDIHNQWVCADDYLNFIWQKYKSLKKYRSDVPLYLISDTFKLISLWQKKYQTGIRIPNLASKNLSKNGIHKLRKNEICYDTTLSKKEINFECIRDFVLMLNSRILIGDGVSLYSNVASIAKSINITLLKLD